MTHRPVLQSDAVLPLSKMAVLLALLTAGGCRSSFEKRTLPPPPDSTAEQAQLTNESLYVPGEYLAWSVKWKGLSGGVTRWVIGEPGMLDGRKTIICKSETRGDGLIAVFKHVREELTTVIDLDHGGPSRSASIIEEGRGVENLDVSFNGLSYHAKMRIKGDDQERTWEQAVPDGKGHTDDLHTAMGHLRLWNPPTGTRGYLYAQSGQSFYKVQVVAAGREQIRTEAGDFATVRMEGTADLISWRGIPPKKPKQRRFTAWFSDDDYHLPVRIVGETAFGDVYADLAEFARPEGVVPLRLTH